MILNLYHSTATVGGGEVANAGEKAGEGGKRMERWVEMKISLKVREKLE